MIYQWKTNAHVKAPAQVAGEICARLENSGGLTPKKLLDESRPVEAPLHGEFEWDDSVAAEAYREGQAAHIIRCIVVRPEDKVQEPIRAFYNITRSEHEYISLNVVLKDPDKIEALLEQAMKDMQAFKTKYSRLNGLEKVILAMDEFLASLDCTWAPVCGSGHSTIK